MAKTCSVDRCTNKHHAKEFCKNHYARWKRYGNPLYVPNPEDTRKKIADKLTGKPFSKEHRENLSKAAMGRPSPRKGIPVSDAQKRKQSEKMKGRPSPRKGTTHSKESKLKMSKARIGKKDSPETKIIKSIAHNKPATLELSRLRGLEVQSRPGQKAKTSKSLKITYGTPEGKQMQRERRYMVKYHRTPKNEKLVQSFLIEQKIVFEPHYNIRLSHPRKYAEADILIKPNKIIDVRGDRTHANPKYYSPDAIIKPYHNGIILAGELQKRDNETFNLLKNEGYEILVLWENEFGSRNNPKITRDIERKISEFLRI